jgi:eukaryotic-like serine/threonine-protein kinase
MFASVNQKKPSKIEGRQDRVAEPFAPRTPLASEVKIEIGGVIGTLQGMLAKIGPNDNQPPVGASMKFQYGNGDKPLDGFVIKRGVGSGGFGEVYFAESESGKEVALKRIQKNLEVEVRGVRHCLNLRHPNLVGIYDIKFDREEQGWIVMEFIAGESLRDRIDRYSQSVKIDEAVGLFAQLAAGVAYLHDQGIVHRDLKPANVFIDNGLIKIGDYGLSKYISASRRGGQTESVGTFHYMAPEIGKGEYGKEIDIYSLGVILYELLTGYVPFDGESSQEIILKHLTADPDVSMIPQPYASTIQRALAKNSTSRFRDCRDLLRSIGWDLDTSGMAVRSPEGAVAATVPPVLREINVKPLAQPKRQPIGNDASTLAGSQPMAALAYAASGERQNTFQEPVARAVNQMLIDAQNWFRSLPSTPRGIAIAGLIVGLVVLGNLLAPIAFLLMIAYAVYYAIWYVGGGPKHAQAQLQVANQANRPRQEVRAHQAHAVRPPHGANVQANYVAMPSPPVAQPKPVSYRVAYRNWQNAQREQLKQRGLWSYVHSQTHAWSFSGLVIGVMAVASALLTHARVDGDSAPLMGGIAWTGIMALLTSWTVIFFSRRWEGQAEDSIVYRFIMMTAGVALGAASFALSNYLMIPWPEVARTGWEQINLNNGVLNPGDWNKSWKGFYEGETPLLAAHIAYFASLMWIVRWWRQSDSLRKSRFSIFVIAWSVAMAALVQGLFYFPAPWCLFLAGGVSFAVQMASPWTPYDDSTRTA